MLNINGAAIPANTRSALDSARKGVQKSEADFAKAADEIIKSFVDGANAVSAPNGEGPNIAASSEANLVSGIVDSKFAEAAYKANLETIKAVDDMQKEAIDILA